MKVYIHGTDVSDKYTPEELGRFEIVQSAVGTQPGQGNATVISPDGTLEPYAGQSFKIVVGAVTVFNGFCGAMTRDRSSTAQHTRLANVIDVVDENAMLNGYRAGPTKRPKETDVARMRWAVGHYLEHAGLDTTYLLSTNAKKVPAKEYRTEDIFGELQSDCGDPTGKTLFVENRRLHWHQPGDGATAGLTIVDSGEDRVTSFALDSAQPPRRDKDPADLATSVVAINSKNQKARADDSAALARYDSDGIKHYRLIDSPDSDREELQDLADGLLAQHKTERFTYMGTIRNLTAAQTVLIPPGSLVTCTDVVWGVTATALIVGQRTLKYVHPDKFDVTLELSNPPRVRAGAGGSTGTTTPPPPVVIPPPFVPELQGNCGPYPLTPSGTTLPLSVQFGTFGTGPIYVHSDGFLRYSQGSILPAPPAVGETDTLTFGTFGTIDYAACDVNNSFQLYPIGNGTLTVTLTADPSHGTPYFDVTRYDTIETTYTNTTVIATNVNPGVFVFTISGKDASNDCPTAIVFGNMTSHGMGAAGVGFNSAKWVASGTIISTPATSQEVTENVTAPGGTLIGHTRFPYIPGSLRISGNGTPLQGNGIDFTETDPHLGLYAFTHTAPAGTEFVIKYSALGGNDAGGSGGIGDDTQGSLPGGAAGGPVISPVTPPALTTGPSGGFYPGVVLVQNETAAGYARMVTDASTTMAQGQHYAQFGPACDGSGSATRFHQGDGMALKVLYGGMAPASLDIHGVGCAGNQSRLANTTAVGTFAGLINTMLAGDSAIKIVTFWNELKGYYNSAYTGSWDAIAYCADYITFATAIKAAHPTVKIAGPYSTGQSGQNEVGGLDERTRYIHQKFIDLVVTLHPTLVDYIAWDDGDGTKHRSYTKFYTDRSVTLPHICTEWYPPNSPGTIARILLDMATNPQMKIADLWGSGTDTYRYAPLWDSSGTPTNNWKAMVKVAAFTAVGSVQNTAPNTWVNSSAQTCTVVGDVVTVV